MVDSNGFKHKDIDEKIWKAFFKFFYINRIVLTLFRMGFFGAAHGWGGAFWPALRKIRHTNPTMMKLRSYTLPKEVPKNV